MLLAGAIFAGLAFISMVCRVRYRGVEGKSPEDVEDDIQKMLRAKTRLLENWRKGVHERANTTDEFQEEDTIRSNM